MMASGWQNLSCSEAQQSIGGFLMKSKVLIGLVIAAFALAATTDVVSAASKKKHAAAKVTPATFDSGPPASLKCKKGEVPVLHSANPTKLKWGCVKSA
jgi:hypothetical protein